MAEPPSPQTIQDQLPPNKQHKLTRKDYERYAEQKSVWKARDVLLREIANEDISTANWIVRQHYKWGPRHPEYLALDDIELRLEYLRIRAWNHNEKHGSLPGTEAVEGEMESFNDAVELLTSGLLDDDDLWEELNDDLPVLENASPILRKNLILEEELE